MIVTAGGLKVADDDCAVRADTKIILNDFLCIFHVVLPSSSKHCEGVFISHAPRSCNGERKLFVLWLWFYYFKTY
jgi:hypothetical protein